jgi:hypothetical protein
MLQYACHDREEGPVDWLLLQLEISVTNGRFAPL